MRKAFPFYAQHNSLDCGPACLRMIGKWYGYNLDFSELQQKARLTYNGTSLLTLSHIAETIGFRTTGCKLQTEQLKNDVSLPCILHWRENHFVILYRIRVRKNSTTYYLADPAHGLVTFQEHEFLTNWTGNAHNTSGICLLLEPTSNLQTQNNSDQKQVKSRRFLSYLKPYRRLLIQLILGMLAGSVIQLFFPLLTQAVVDIGINSQDLAFISIILIAQLMLMFSQATVEFIRSWILLHISTRINFSLISDFLTKIMKLPIAYFDTGMTGDFLQRIGDQARIENFLTSGSIQIIFSLFNLLIFTIILAFYSTKVVIVFLIGSILHFCWIFLFMKKRKNLDYRRFNQLSAHQSQLIEIISGMQEIKLNTCERQKRWKWEEVQAKLFKLSTQSLALNQYQSAGGVIFNQAKNIFITFITARAVVDGNLTLGMMLAIQFILGQANSPVESMALMIREIQDAKLSMERLEVINNIQEEVDDEKAYDPIPDKKSIHLRNISFAYNNSQQNKVIQSLNADIPHGKVTAIVGNSGSGKTTLLRLMMGFYNPQEGEVIIDQTALSSIHPEEWRKICGSVLQNGYIFADTIAANIATGSDDFNEDRVLKAADTACLSNEISTFPLGLKTKIGQDGNGLSQGQRQRILIARAVYKNPDILFLDEATNSLDANNEKTILTNLKSFYAGKTVVVVAHRLSTIKDADNIIVLKDGHIEEQGTHNQLIKNRNSYFELVKNQLNGQQ